jgi:MerR family transcriptional regulator, heat shock protein HspR
MMERNRDASGNTGNTSNAEYYRIEVAANLVGLPAARVRRYLKVGLVQASSDERGVLVLETTELVRLRKIRRLTTDLGLNLAGVEVVLRLLDQIDQMQALLDQSSAPNASTRPGQPRQA